MHVNRIRFQFFDVPAMAHIVWALKKRRRILPVCFLAVLLVSCNESPQQEGPRTVTIDNVQPRRDVSGQIIDAHGGCLQFFDGRFYLYGTAYGTNHNSLALNCPFVVYSSPDLGRWTFEGKLLKEQPKGVYTRPSVVFDPKTRKYVLWYNWFPKLWSGQTGVAVSDTPVGPFTVVNPKANLVGKDPGDGSLFVDDDGTGYYIYTAMGEGYAIRVERLTPDYLDLTRQASQILAFGGEAPVMFRRKNIYYALLGPRCPDCPQGSEVQVFTANSPLGPFVTKPNWNINRRADAQTPVVSARKDWGVEILTPEGKVNYTSTNNDSVIAGGNTPFIHAQQTWVAKIPTVDGAAFIWIGDCWGSAPDGIKGHDGQFWSAPLQFTADGQILPIKDVARWYMTRTLKN